MLKIFTFFIILTLAIPSKSQNRNSNWCFGDSAGINFSNLSNPVPITSSINARGSCVSISDSAGNLLFYGSTFYRYLWSMGCVDLGVIYNSSGQVMDGGDSIVGRGWFEELTIIPFPDNSKKFYLFSVGTSLPHLGLYYSIIDMNQNVGLGKVVSKNIQLNTLSGFDGITATKHGNGRDWWLIFHPEGDANPANNAFFNYLITPQGISNPVVDSIGTVSYSVAGHTVFSKDGSKFALATWNNLLEVFNFDRCTGHFSNPIIIEPESSTPAGSIWATSFSPDGNLLYRQTGYVGGIHGIGYLLQYDMLAGNIQASRDTIYTFNYPENPFHIRLAPDDKIYLSSAYDNYTDYPDSIRNNINENLSVIYSPNNLGTACDFQPYSFYLGGKRTYNGLPNNPDYEMGPLLGSGCDSLVGVPGITYEVQRQELHVFFHPGWQVAFVNAEGLKGKNYSLHVYDLTGREVFREEGKHNGAYFTRDLRCEGFANGMYIVNLRTEKEVLSKKFIKQ